MIQSPCYVPTTPIVMFFGKGNPPDTTSIVPTTEKISNQTLTDGGGSENKFETFVEHEIGGIVGLVFGLLFSAALILAAWITYRRHRARNEEYRRDMEVFLKSKRNAGVYRDTTVDTPPIVRHKDAVYDSLREQGNLHEHDSEEEF